MSIASVKAYAILSMKYFRYYLLLKPLLKGVSDTAWVVWFFFFFFQAEDGIRDIGVTGVQTCALPICVGSRMSISRLCVRISNCSRDFLSTCGLRSTVYLFFTVGRGIGPATRAPVRLAVDRKSVV